MEKSKSKPAETKRRIDITSFASVYPHYMAKVLKKDRNKEELDQLIHWLTGYTSKQLESVLANKVTFEDFFLHAPKLNPKRILITGVICGVNIQEIQDPLMKEIRYLDKIVDELAKGKPLSKIFRE